MALGYATRFATRTNQQHSPDALLWDSCLGPSLTHLVLINGAHTVQQVPRQVPEVDPVVNQRGDAPALTDRTVSQGLGNEQIASKQTNKTVTLAVLYVMRDIKKDVGENK